MISIKLNILGTLKKRKIKNSDVLAMHQSLNIQEEAKLMDQTRMFWNKQASLLNDYDIPFKNAETQIVGKSKFIGSNEGKKYQIPYKQQHQQQWWDNQTLDTLPTAVIIMSSQNEVAFTNKACSTFVFGDNLVYSKESFLMELLSLQVSVHPEKKQTFYKTMNLVQQQTKQLQLNTAQIVGNHSQEKSIQGKINDPQVLLEGKDTQNKEYNNIPDNIQQFIDPRTLIPMFYSSWNQQVVQCILDNQQILRTMEKKSVLTVRDLIGIILKTSSSSLTPMNYSDAKYTNDSYGDLKSKHNEIKGKKQHINLEDTCFLGYSRKGKLSYELKFTCQYDNSCQKYYATIQISDLTQWRAQLLECRVQEYKKRVLCSVSHELRTPLNCSIQLLDMLSQEEGLQEVVKQTFVQPALYSNYLLLNIISDILDLAQINYGEFRLAFQVFDLKKILVECINLISLQAAQKKIDISMEFEGLVPTFVHSDPNRLRQVLLNLLSNSLKFTQQGKITLKASILDHSKKLNTIPCADQEAQIIQIDVKDTGCGISPGKLIELIRKLDHYGQESEEDDIFDEDDDLPSENKLNSGLGLTIANNLASGLGCNRAMTVHSREKEGSVFSFFLVNHQERYIGCHFKRAKIISEKQHPRNWECFSHSSLDVSQKSNNYNNNNNDILVCTSKHSYHNNQINHELSLQKTQFQLDQQQSLNMPLHSDLHPHENPFLDSSKQADQSGNQCDHSQPPITSQKLYNETLLSLMRFNTEVIGQQQQLNNLPTTGCKSMVPPIAKISSELQLVVENQKMNNTLNYPSQNQLNSTKDNKNNYDTQQSNNANNISYFAGRESGMLNSRFQITLQLGDSKQQTTERSSKLNPKLATQHTGSQHPDEDRQQYNRKIEGFRRSNSAKKQGTIQSNRCKTCERDYHSLTNIMQESTSKYLPSIKVQTTVLNSNENNNFNNNNYSNDMILNSQLLNSSPLNQIKRWRQQQQQIQQLLSDRCDEDTHHDLNAELIDQLKQTQFQWQLFQQQLLRTQNSSDQSQFAQTPMSLSSNNHNNIAFTQLLAKSSLKTRNSTGNLSSDVQSDSCDICVSSEHVSSHSCNKKTPNVLQCLHMTAKRNRNKNINSINHEQLLPIQVQQQQQQQQQPSQNLLIFPRALTTTTTTTTSKTNLPQANSKSRQSLPSLNLKLSMIHEKSNELMDSLVQQKTQFSEGFTEVQTQTANRTKHGNLSINSNNNLNNNNNIYSSEIQGQLQEAQKSELESMVTMNCLTHKETYPVHLPSAAINSDQQQNPCESLKDELIAFNLARSCECANVLIVDDNEFNLFALELRLKQYKFIIDKATSGIKAIEFVHGKYESPKQCCQLYSVIFMDIDMPIKNGYQTTKEILSYFEMKRIHNPTPISACSAYVQEQEKSNAKRSGMSYYITKPVSQQALEIVLKSTILKKQSSNSNGNTLRQIHQ